MTSPITRYFHCRQCVVLGLKSQLEGGLTDEGVRWDCKKHGLLGHMTPTQLRTLVESRPACDCCPGGVHVDETVEGIVAGLRARGREADGLDADLASRTPAQLAAEVRKLRTGIRRHRDSSGHDLCWYVPELWGLLPERGGRLPVVPPREEFLARCSAYRNSLDGVPPMFEGNDNVADPSRNPK